MKKIVVIVPVSLLICSCLSSSLAVQADDTARDIEIKLERGMCYGTCPVYSVSLSGNGTVSWVGEMFVEVTGNQTGYVDPALVGDLYDLLTEGGILDFEDSYNHRNITDMPSAILTVRNGSFVKSVYHYHGDFTAPEELVKMERAVDNVANSGRWIGKYTQGEEIVGELI